MQEEMAVNFAREVRAQNPQIEGNKIWLMSKKEFPANCSIGRDRFLNLMDQNGIRQRSRKPRTTDSTHGLPVYPDLTKRLIPQRINQLWVSDITYIPILLHNGQTRVLLLIACTGHLQRGDYRLVYRIHTYNLFSNSCPGNGFTASEGCPKRTTASDPPFGSGCAVCKRSVHPPAQSQ